MIQSPVLGCSLHPKDEEHSHLLHPQGFGVSRTSAFPRRAFASGSWRSWICCVSSQFCFQRWKTLSPGISSITFPEVQFLAGKETWKGQLLSVLPLESSLEPLEKREMGKVLGPRTAGCDVTSEIPWQEGVDGSIPVFQA